MKRILALFALGLGCSSAMANTGIINFEGSVKAGGTCPISVVTPGGPGLPKLYLGDFKAEDFTAAGMKTPLQRFALRLDPATCPSPPADTTVTFNAGYGADPTNNRPYRSIAFPTTCLRIGNRCSTSMCRKSLKRKRSRRTP